MKSKMKKQNSKYGITLAVALCISMMFFITGCGDLSKSDSDPDVKPPDPNLSLSINRILPGACTTGNPDVRLSIFASVIDETGAAVKNLTKENFKLFNDNKSVAIEEPFWEEVINAPFAATLVMDYSNSMTAKAKSRMETAANSFVNLLSEGVGNPDVVEIIKFANGYEVMADFTDNKQTLLKAIKESHKQSMLGDATHLFDVLHHAISNTAVRPERRVIVLLSDGKDKKSQFFKGKKAELIQFAKKKNVQIFTISPRRTTTTGETLLQDIADGTNGVFLHAPSSKQYEDIFRNISENLKNQYVIDCLVDTNSSLEEKLFLEVKDPRNLTASAEKNYIPCPNIASISENNPYPLPGMSTGARLTSIDIHAPMGDPQYAFVGASGERNGLRIIDISTQRPSQVESVKIGIGNNDSVRDVQVIFPYLYVAGYTEGFLIYDIVITENPKTITIKPAGSIKNFTKVTEVAVSGSYAYIMDETAGLRVIDIADPANPVEINITESNLNPKTGRNLNAQNGMVYFTNQGNLYIVDATEEGSLKWVGDATLTGNSARGAYLSYPYVYIIDTGINDALKAVNIRNPEAPSQLNSVFSEGNTGSYPVAFNFRKSNVFIATNDTPNNNNTQIKLYKTDTTTGTPDQLEINANLPIGTINETITIVDAKLLDQNIYTITSTELRIFDIN